MTVRLKEASALTLKGSKYRVRLISAGKGSSGLYESATLQRDGASAFPAGTHIFWDHLTDDEDDARGGNHSIKDLVGVTLTEALYENDALHADVNFFSHVAPLIHEIKDHIALSIEASGEIREGVVESIKPSPLNAISIVPRGGRDGKILELIESYRESQNDGNIGNNEPVKESTQEDGKDQGMKPEDIQALAEALKEALSPALTEIKEALKPVEPVVPEQTDAPKVADVAEAVVVAFPKSEASRKRVYEALDAGTELDDAIAAEKALVESVRKEFDAESNDDDTVIREGHRKTEDDDFTVGGW
jgi:hypothetical protein